MSKTLKLGLLGDNLSRSRLKDLHEMIGEILDIQVTFTAMDLKDRGLVDIGAELHRCANEGFNGVNVTHPYKPSAYNAVSDTTSLPPGLTTINTVVFDNNGLTGFNTDYSGFVRGFRTVFGHDAKPGRVLMLGCGGVGKAIAFGLSALGAEELVVHDIREGSVETLITEMDGSGLPVRLAAADLLHEMEIAHGIVNATPIGMFQYPGCAFPKRAIENQRWAFDAVYTPENTEFLDACRKQDIATLSGFKLFLYQGQDAFEFFSGIRLDEEAVESTFLNRFPLE